MLIYVQNTGWCVLAFSMAQTSWPTVIILLLSTQMMVEGQEERVKTWTDVLAMNRQCASAAKTLLLLHIIPKCEGTDMSSPLRQGDFTIEAVEVRRWLPEKNREENDSPIQS